MQNASILKMEPEDSLSLFWDIEGTCVGNAEHISLKNAFKSLSNKKVTKVFPPERKVKYSAFRQPCTGKNNAVITIKLPPSLRTSSDVSYKSGKIPEMETVI